MPKSEDRTLYLIEALLLILLGIAAIVVPGVFTLSLELLFGAILIIAGVYQLYRVWVHRETPHFWIASFSSLLNIILGLLFLLNPLAGILTLTLLLIVYFIVIGVLQITWAWQLRHQSQWGWIFASGILSLLMGAILISGWPSSAIWAIGLLFGINVLFSGIALWNVAWNIPKTTS